MRPSLRTPSTFPMAVHGKTPAPTPFPTYIYNSQDFVSNRANTILTRIIKLAYSCWVSTSVGLKCTVETSTPGPPRNQYAHHLSWLLRTRLSGPRIRCANPEPHTHTISEIKQTNDQFAVKFLGAQALSFAFSFCLFFLHFLLRYSHRTSCRSLGVLTFAEKKTRMSSSLRMGRRKAKALITMYLMD